MFRKINIRLNMTLMQNSQHISNENNNNLKKKDE